MKLEIKNIYVGHTACYNCLLKRDSLICRDHKTGRPHKVLRINQALWYCSVYVDDPERCRARKI